MAKKSKSTVSGIKPEVVENHIGVYKYTNDDWSTIAFTIPRDQIGTKFYNEELQYNCIYFLFGFENDIHEKVYVGQAAIRLDGTSVLKRLREHDKSKKESYRDIWKWAVVVTNKEDKWSTANLDALEHILCNMIPEHMNLKNPSHGGENLEDYDEKVKHIVSYVNTLNFKVFKELDNEDTPQILDEINDKTEKVEDLQKGMSKIPEIVTPPNVVKAMVDMLPEDVWNDKTVFLDPACKGGEYLREIYDRLMEAESLQAKYPDEFERHTHILSEQLYGIALSKISLERTTKNLRGYGHNIKIIPNYIHKLKGKLLGSKADRSNKKIKDIINEEFNRDMKIDVIIGNPPYQDSNGSGNGGGGTAVYDKFVLNAFDISSQYISFVTPARWYTAESKVTEMKNKLLNCNNLKELHDFPDTSQIFNGVYIMGGVCYYLIDKKYIGKCQVVEHRDNTKISKLRFLKEKNIDIFIRNSLAVSIVQKVVNEKDFTQLYDYIQDYNIFKLRSYERGKEEYSDKYNIKMYYTGNDAKGGKIGYIDRDSIYSGINLIDKHKIYINSVSDNMLSFPYKTLYKAFYGEPNSVCTESYLVIGPIIDKIYADNIIKYLATQFVRFIVQQRKTSQLAYKRVYKFVPFQDFTFKSDIDWSKSISDIDQQLYTKYNLTQEEIDYIERTIKPME